MSSDMFSTGNQWPVDPMQTDPAAPAATTDQSSLDYAFNPGSLKLDLSAEEQVNSTAKITAIFQSEEALPAENEEMPDADEEEPEVDLEDQRRRTELLKEVLPTLAQLWWCQSEYMDVVTEKLADGSRDLNWRIPLGDSGILNFFLQIFGTHTLGTNLVIQTLRLIGNSCADTDENRARVVALNSLPSIIAQLGSTSALPFAIPVLYNICLDYEPAQKQASDSSLTGALLGLVTPERKWEVRPFLSYVRKIVELLVTQPSEFELAPDNTAFLFLKIAAYSKQNAADMDDFISVVNLAVAYLQDVKFQRGLIVHGELDLSLTVLVNSYTRFDSQPLTGDSELQDEDEAKALQQMRSSLNQALSDVSALPEFKDAVPVVSSFSSSLRRWLSSPQLQLQVCACIMLGNLARSDAACEEFVHTCAVHKPLVTVLTNATDPQLLHAALGFLKNLALPAKNKEAIGDAGIFDVLPRLWLLDSSQQIQFSSVSLARQLINGTFENVRRVCRALSRDKDSPAHMRSKLTLLIALYDRTDVEPIKMEIARLITAVCRVFNTLKGRTEERMDYTRRKFFEMHPDIGRPLSFMITQNKWPVVRSEGWFVFALMSRYPEGAQCIGDLMHDVEVFQPLVFLLTGKSLIDYKPERVSSGDGSVSTPADTPAAASDIVDSSLPQLDLPTPESVKSDTQAAEMARIDRQNALVLVSELLRNRGDEMAVVRKTLLEDLLRGGANAHLAATAGLDQREHAMPAPPVSIDDFT